MQETSLTKNTLDNDIAHLKETFKHIDGIDKDFDEFREIIDTILFNRVPEKHDNLLPILAWADNLMGKYRTLERGFRESAFMKINEVLEKYNVSSKTCFMKNKELKEACEGKTEVEQRTMGYTGQLYMLLLNCFGLMGGTAINDLRKDFYCFTQHNILSQENKYKLLPSASTDLIKKNRKEDILLPDLFKYLIENTKIEFDKMIQQTKASVSSNKTMKFFEAGMGLNRAVRSAQHAQAIEPIVDFFGKTMVDIAAARNAIFDEFPELLQKDKFYGCAPIDALEYQFDWSHMKNELQLLPPVLQKKILGILLGVAIQDRMQNNSIYYPYGGAQMYSLSSPIELGRISDTQTAIKIPRMPSVTQDNFYRYFSVSDDDTVVVPTEHVEQAMKIVALEKWPVSYAGQPTQIASQLPQIGICQNPQKTLGE